MVEPNVFSIGIGFFPLTYKKCIILYTLSLKHQITMSFTGKSKVLGGTCFMSPVRHLEYGGAPRFLENYVYPCFKSLWFFTTCIHFQNTFVFGLTFRINSDIIPKQN